MKPPVPETADDRPPPRRKPPIRYVPVKDRAHRRGPFREIKAEVRNSPQRSRRRMGRFDGGAK